MLGLVVETKNDGVLIFPSDAIYTRANYGPPAKLSGIVYDSLSFFESIEKVRRLAKKHNAKVMFPHDMEFFKTLKLAPECYEWHAWPKRRRNNYRFFGTLAQVGWRVRSPPPTRQSEDGHPASVTSTGASFQQRHGKDETCRKSTDFSEPWPPS